MANMYLAYETLAAPIKELTEFQVRWRWRPRTVAFWDNCWTQHCALADYFPASRRVRRATILGERPV
jgi:taurine dioxygenase